MKSFPKAIFSSVLTVVLVVGFLPVPAASQGAQINHNPAACVDTDGFPMFNADIQGDMAVPPRFYFRCDPASMDFYYVEMTPVDGAFQAVLPMVLQPPCDNIVYYIEVIDADGNPSTSPESDPDVAPGSCDEDNVPAGAAPNIKLFTAAGAPIAAIPGFAALGIAPVAGGMSALAVGGIVGAGAATTGVVAYQVTKDESPSTPQ